MAVTVSAIIYYLKPNLPLYKLVQSIVVLWVLIKRLLTRSSRNRLFRKQKFGKKLYILISLFRYRTCLDMLCINYALRYDSFYKLIS